MRWLLPLLASIALTACGGPPQPYTGGRVDQLSIVDEAVGNGATARPGDTVQVRYTGWLYEQKAKDHRGAKFDSSDDHPGAAPLSFALGTGQVIAGWDQGVTGMRVGGKRTLLIPPQLGYGERGAGNAIPPGASLVFEVQLQAVQPR
jgi:FKBP-type peptidyl-prolyl cis-trans isomerase FkpA